MLSAVFTQRVVKVSDGQFDLGCGCCFFFFFSKKKNITVLGISERNNLVAAL